jgi:hypothetical protein
MKFTELCRGDATAAAAFHMETARRRAERERAVRDEKESKNARDRQAQTVRKSWVTAIAVELDSKGS